METNNLIPLHQTRTITAYEPSVGKRVFQTTANTFGELKVDLINQGYNLQNVNVTEGFTKLGLVNDATILPKNIEFKGVVSNNLAIVMTPKEKPKSGIRFEDMSRKQLVAEITRLRADEHDGARAKEFFGNHSIKKSSVLIALLNEWFKSDVLEHNGEATKEDTIKDSALVKLLDTTVQQLVYTFEVILTLVDSKNRHIADLEKHNELLSGTVEKLLIASDPTKGIDIQDIEQMYEDLI